MKTIHAIESLVLTGVTMAAIRGATLPEVRAAEIANSQIGSGKPVTRTLESCGAYWMPKDELDNKYLNGDGGDPRYVSMQALVDRTFNREANGKPKSLTKGFVAVADNGPDPKAPGYKTTVYAQVLEKGEFYVAWPTDNNGNLTAGPYDANATGLQVVAGSNGGRIAYDKDNNLVLLDKNGCVIAIR